MATQMLVYVNIVFVYEEEAKSLNIKSFFLQYEHNLMINESYTSQIMMHGMTRLIVSEFGQIRVRFPNVHKSPVYLHTLLAGERFTVSITGEVSYT